MKKTTAILLVILMILTQGTIFAEPVSPITPADVPALSASSLNLTSMAVESDRATTQTKWRVTNESGVDVSFTYQVGSQTGTLVVPAAHTNADRFTNPFYFYVNAPHPATATIKWGETLQFSKTKASTPDTILVPSSSSITLTSMGIEPEHAAGKTKWRLVNNFGQDLSFTWQVYGTAITGSGTLPKEHTLDARFDNPYYLYVDAPYPATLIVKWGSESQFSTQKASGGQIIYPPLTSSSLGLTAMPIEGNKPGQTKWRVVNNYGYPVTFTWNVHGTSHTGTLTIPAAHTNDARFDNPFYFYAPVAHPATMKITWGTEPQFTATKASNPEVLPYPTASSLVLTSMDTEELRAGTETKWRVINKFGQPLTFTYTVAGRPDITGTLTVGAEHTEAARFENPFYFYLPVAHPATVIISWGDNKEFKNTKASGGKIIEDKVPTIQLNGDSPLTLAFGAAYTEAGAVATDPEDGTLKVAIEGTVNTNLAGTYTLTYSAMDRMEHAVSVTRTVIVQAQVTTQAPTTQAPTTTQPPATSQPETQAPVVTTQPATEAPTTAPTTVQTTTTTTTVAPVILPEATVPQGGLVQPTTAEAANQAGENANGSTVLAEVVLNEENVPQGSATLPQTGEGNFIVFYVLGIAILGAGAWILKR